MAEDSGQDKTEDPTGKRLTDSRNKGQIARSKELNVFVTLIISAAMFLYLGGKMARELLDMMKQQFHISRDMVFDPMTPLIFLKQAFSEGFSVIAPLLLVLLIADLLTPLLMGGWNFTTEGFAFNFGKLNPLSGIKKIIGIQGVVEFQI